MNAIAAYALGAAIVLAVAADARAAAGDDGSRLLELINGYRAEHRLPPVAQDSALSGLAVEHARRMARAGTLSHDAFRQRFERSNAHHGVETVGWNHPTPKAEFEAWRDSPEHDRNLLDGPIRRAGLAIDAGYAVFFACG